MSLVEWASQRRDMVVAVGAVPSLPTMILSTLRSEGSWKPDAFFCEQIMHTKEAVAFKSSSEP